MTLEEIRQVNPRDRTEEQQEFVNEFHEKSLAEFYHSWGVGDTVSHKARFWDKYCPNSYISHFDPGSEQWVKAMEMVWVTETFPQDMIFC